LIQLHNDAQHFGQFVYRENVTLVLKSQVVNVITTSVADLDPDSLVRGMDPDPDPSIIMQK
jgi:hypothetical protein